MVSSRASISSMLFDIVDGDIKSNKVSKAALVKETRDKICKGLTNRVFDNLPRVIDDEQLGKLSNDYLAIVCEARFSGEENLEPNMATQRNIKALMRGLIGKGMTELFNEKDRIRESLLDLFGWGDLIECIDKPKLVSAYVGAVMAQLMQCHQTVINDALSHNNGRICSYLNNHYPQWIEEMVNERELRSVDSFTPVGIATIASSLLVGVVAFGLFAARASASSVTDSPEYNGPEI